jgi:antitoxin HicB
MATKRFTVSDGKLVLCLTPDPEGGYCVTSPLDPGLITQGDSIEEAFDMAYDALKTLTRARKKFGRLDRVRSDARRRP